MRLPYTCTACGKQASIVSWRVSAQGRLMKLCATCAPHIGRLRSWNSKQDEERMR